MNRGIIWCPHCGQPHALGTKICPVASKTLEREVNKPNELAHPLVGMTIAGQYKVLRLIGSGGMGEVFEAENRLKRRVALKIVRGATATPEAIARLERECLLVSAVQHPNICDVYDSGVLTDGSPFIVLERLFGETFAKYISRKGKLPLAVTLDFLQQVLSGLQAAHGAQIVHRDLKPQNVYLCDRLGCAPIVKLLDFGLARDVSGVRARTITKPGALLGTLKYMAPEQLKAERADARADIFAVGVMFYEALAGRHPFEGPTLADIQTNILRCDFIPLAERRTDIPVAFADLIDRCLQKSVNDRWNTCVDMQRAVIRAAGSGAYGFDAEDGEPPSKYP